MDILDKLMAEGRFAEALEIVNENAARPPMGQGGNLKALNRISQDIAAKPRSYMPNFEMIGKPFESGFTMPEAPKMPMDLVPSSGNLPSTDVIETTARQLSGEGADSFLSKAKQFLGRAGSSAGAQSLKSGAGKALSFATNPYVDTAAGMMASEEINPMANAEQVAVENPSAVPAYSFLKENIDRAMGGNQPPVQIPFRNAMEQQPKASAAPAPAAQEELAKQIERAAAASAQEGPKAPEMAPYKDEYTDQLSSAQSATTESAFINNLYRAALMAGAGIAGTKADYGMADTLDKQRPGILQGAKDRIASTKQGKEEAEMAPLKDPNSDISKQARDTFRKVFGRELPPGTSAHQLSKAGVNLNTLLGYEENAKARREAAATQKELKGMEVQEAKSKAEETKNKDAKRFAQGLRKEATAGAYGKVYNGLQNADRSSAALQSFAKNPDGYKDYGSLMLALKALQGDDSIVREMEIRMGVNSTSMFNSWKNAIQSAATGKKLQPEQRKQMIDAVNVVRDISKKQYLQAIQPLLQHADDVGVDRKFILPPEFRDDVEKPKEESTKAKSTVKLSKKLEPGKTLRHKDGRVLKVNADGETATEL